MTITPTYLKAQVPQFVPLSDAQMQRVIDEAYAELNADVWDTRLETGVFYLSAHKAVCSFLRGGSAGAIQSETVGQVSRSYATGTATGYGSTSFGMEFERLVRTLPTAVLPIVMGVY